METPTATLNHYETLGVPETADATTIKEAFRLLVLKHHPDKQPSSSSNSRTTDNHVLVNQIQNAYQVLRDSAQRKEYDEYLRLDRSRKHSRFESSILVERSDCTMEIDNTDGSAMLVYPCRCGTLLDTSPLPDDDDDEQVGQEESLDKEDGLLECPGCSLVYDIRKLNTQSDESSTR